MTRWGLKSTPRISIYVLPALFRSSRSDPRWTFDVRRWCTWLWRFSLDLIPGTSAAGNSVNHSHHSLAGPHESEYYFYGSLEDCRMELMTWNFSKIDLDPSPCFTKTSRMIPPREIHEGIRMDCCQPHSFAARRGLDPDASIKQLDVCIWNIYAWVCGCVELRDFCR